MCYNKCGDIMNTIKTIDLWTEARNNHYDCFNGAFIDGFCNDCVAFDKYKVIKNCNCIIDVQPNKFNINNKHNAIIFYKDNKPVRLLVCNKNTDVDKCIDVALKQDFDNGIVLDLFNKYNIQREDIDLGENAIGKDEFDEEIDVGSCDRWGLLYSMLKGYYTESDSEYGNFLNDKYYFIPNLLIKYSLVVLDDSFEIIHKCAFINEDETRIIPIQENSKLVL